MIAAPYVADAAAPIPAQVQTPAPSAYIVSDKPYIGIQESEDIPANSPEELWSVDTNPACDGIPLEYDLAHQLVESCLEHDVPLELAIAVMEQESGFQPDAVGPDGHDFGLFQIRDSNHSWLSKETESDPMTPEGNIVCGVWLIGYLLDRYNSTDAALTAYRYGHDNGERLYAEKVLDSAKTWKARLR